MDNVVIAALIGGGVTFIVTIITVAAAWRTNQKNQDLVGIETFKGLVDKVEDQSITITDIQRHISTLESKNSALWSYVYELVEYIREHAGKPPRPPISLETDPRLSKLLKEKDQNNV